MKRSLQILLVEDNMDQVELTLAALNEWDPAAVVTEAHNGPEALAKIEQKVFDLILLDYSLPGMNGIEILKAIQSKALSPPVIMVTGQGAESIAVDAMKQGAQDYIVKTGHYYETLPISVEKVLEKNRLRMDLDEASLRTRRLYEILLSVTKERKVDLLTELLVKGASELTWAEKSILLLIDSERSEVIFSKSFGIDIEETVFLGPVKAQGLLGVAYTEGRQVVIEDPSGHHLWETTPWLHPFLRQLLAVPLSLQGQVEGMLCVLNKENGQGFKAGDISTLSTLALHAGVAIDNARFVEKMEEQAITDSLTGLLNHMEFQNRLIEEIDRSRRYGKMFSLLMLDLDHFKDVNDTYGHPIGDKVLKETAKILKTLLRSVDLAFRYGGEEFAILLPETDSQGARIIADRIRQEIGRRPIFTRLEESTHVTISIGVSEFPQDADQREDLISAADQALYASKRNGRDRVSLYREVLKTVIENDPINLDDYLLDPDMKSLLDLASVIDAKSPYTKGHTEGVLKYTMHFAKALALDDDQKKSLEFASLLHNIGMVSVPSRLLSGDRPLTHEEMKIIQAHPNLGQMLVQNSSRFDSVLPAILYHHERYDGHGYPNGLKGEEIPYLARILSVVDSYYAMISVRSYRPKRSKAEAIAELRANAGTQFDPKIIAAFIQLIKRDDQPLPDTAPIPD